jgi:hypothetical protein
MHAFFGVGWCGLWCGVVSDPLCLYSSLALHTQFFLSTALLTRMTGISLHVQWALTSQLHGSFLKENNFLLCIKLHTLITLPAQF